MHKKQAIKLLADVLQSVYSKQSRECHETLAECVIDIFMDHGILEVSDTEYHEYLKKAREYIVKENRQCLSMDYPEDTYTQEQESQSSQLLQRPPETRESPEQLGERHSDL